MSGVNKVERFVQNRNRPNIFTQQHQAASGALPDQSLRRNAIAANARVQTPITKLHTPTPSTRIQTAPIEDLGSVIGSNERPNELRRSRTEVTEHSPSRRDIFDTDMEDLTDSLFSDRISTEDGQQQKAQQKHTSHGMVREQGAEHDLNQNNGGRPPRQDLGSYVVKDISDVQDEDDDQDDSSEASGEPGDDPTVTFTPEQAARIQDYSRRALQVVERPKIESQHSTYNESSKPGPAKDLYDLTGPDLQKSEKQATRPILEKSASGPFQTNLPITKDGNGKASYRDRVSVPQPVVHGGGHRVEQQERPLEPSNTTQHETKEVAQPKQAIPGANMPSSEANITNPANVAASTPAVELDYPPDILAGMTYENLLSQPFDTNPSPPPSVLPPNHINSPLPSQLAHVLNLPPNQQRQYFASLTASQWEDCGDWFVEQFTEITGKMREARKQKRKVAMTFEEEIAAREKTVRSKTEGYEKVLEGMKKGGQGLLGKQTTL